MSETRTYQGHTYTRAGPNDPWVLSEPAPVTVGQADPMQSRRSAVDVANTESTIADRARDNARADALAAQQASAAERDTLEWNATHFPDGTPKPKAAASAQANPDRIPQILTVLDNIKSIRQMSDDWLAVGKGSSYVSGDGVLSTIFGQNRANIEGALQMVQGDLIQQQIAILSQMNAGKGVASIANSETEAARMAASVANLSPDQSLEEFTRGVDRAEQYYLRQLARLEGADTSDPDVRKFYDLREPGQPPAPPNALTRLRIGNTTALQSAPFGATEGQTAPPIPPELNAEHDALVARLLQDGGGRLDPEKYAQEFAAIAAKYDFNPPDPAAWARDLNDYLDKGGKTIPSGVQLPDRELSRMESFRNSLVNNPAGSAAASGLNAGGFGIPSLLANEQMSILRRERPLSSFAGEMVGGATGAAMTGKALGTLAGRAGGGTIASLLAKPMTADAIYSGAYGATQSDDPLAGLVGGLALGAGGSWLGGRAGRALAPTPADALSAGERAVAGSVGEADPVIDALMRADELGVPMTLADASPELGSLAGSSVRYSPTVAGDARSIMAQRNQGQLDRLSGAVERDLGPVTNIPQRSEDLLQQARTAARPLYDAAYAAPGASSVQLDDLVQRPTFAEALREAAREAADEGVDPRSLGFDFNEAGDTVLGTTPSWQTLDYAKRGLDNIIEREADKLNGLSPAGRRAVAMKNELLGRMDAINPDYAAARQAYAGPAAERSFLAQGQGAISTRPDQLGVDVARLTPEQRSQMQLGYQSELLGRAGDVRNNNNPWAQLNTPNTEGRLNTLYDGTPDTDIARLLSQRDLELQLAGSANRLVGNSATAEREVADAFFKQQPGMMGDVTTGVLETAALGGPWMTVGKGLLNKFLGNRRKAAAAQGNRALADEIGPILLNDTPGAAAMTLDDIVRRDAEYQQILEELMRTSGQRVGNVGTGVAAALNATAQR